MPQSIKLDIELKENLLYCGPEESGFHLVEEGEWVNEYKDYDSKTNIYQQISSGKYYAYHDSRSGSYYSDYEYDSPTELVEVEPVQITTTIYKAVK